MYGCEYRFGCCAFCSNCIVTNSEDGQMLTLARGSGRLSATSDYDTILRIQYYAYLRTPSAEQKLLFAILEDALRSYVRAKNRHSSVSQTEFREVRNWFSDRRTIAVFSFESVCVNLDINSDCIRKKLEYTQAANFPTTASL